MLFHSAGRQPVLTDTAFAEHIGDITARLTACRHSGTFDGVDRRKLYYEYFLCDAPRGTVVIVHGLSEFTKKYYETAYYLLHEGYHVFMYDQRCHGHSDRLTDERDLIHVDRFSDYVDDLAAFIDTVVVPNATQPLYIYAHSMGGAVTALYLKAHPDKVRKAVLCAPMLEPYIGEVPYPVARLGVRLKALLQGKKAPFRAAQKFNPEAAKKKSTDKSRHRFLHNLKLREDEPLYQSTPLSNGWIDHSLRLVARFRRAKVAERIVTPLLLVSAEKDTVVRNCRHNDFAAKCRRCEHITVAGATHSLLTGSDDSIAGYITRVLDFYRD